MKALDPELAARSDAKIRFLLEIRVQGQLEHPSVVPVYDIGEGPGGERFFTMRRVRGYVLLPAFFLTRVRDTPSVAEDRIFLQAWTMRHLFPKVRDESKEC